MSGGTPVILAQIEIEKNEIVILVLTIMYTVVSPLFVGETFQDF